MSIVTLRSGKNFLVPDGLSILDSASQAGVALPYSCRIGRCNACKGRVLSGSSTPLGPEYGLSDAERAGGWILCCVRTVSSDLLLDVEDLTTVKLPPPRTSVCRISDVTLMSPNVLKIGLRVPPGSPFLFIPGQHLDIIGPAGIRRSYSLANSPRVDGSLELHIKAVNDGLMSRYWFTQARIGDLLRFYGPKGTFFLRDVSDRDVIFFATGTGFAPIKAMLYGLASLPSDQMPRSVSLFWGCRREEDLYFDVRNLPGSFTYTPVLSQPTAWTGERGYVQDIFLRRRSDFRNCVFYACGSTKMIRDASLGLERAGVSLDNFYSDAFVCSDNLPDRTI